MHGFIGLILWLAGSYKFTKSPDPRSRVLESQPGAVSDLCRGGMARRGWRILRMIQYIGNDSCYGSGRS